MDSNNEQTDPVKPKKSLSDYLLLYKEAIAILLSVGSSLWLLVTNLEKQSSDFKEFSGSVNSFLSFVEILNVIVLISAILMLVRKYTLIKKDGLEDTPNLVKLEPDIEGLTDPKHIHLEKRKNVDWKIVRVNKLVSQLNLSLQGFVVVLLFMYALLSLTDLRPQNLTADDKEHLKKEDFINDPSEVADKNSAYNHIVKPLEDKRDTDQNRYVRSIKKVMTAKLLNLKDAQKLTEKSINFIQQRLSDTAKYGIDSIRKFYDRQIIEGLSETRGQLAVLKKRNATLERRNNLIESMYSRHEDDLLDRFAMRYLVVEFVENAFNLFSAAFLFIAFQVLFIVTLSKDNAVSQINYWLPFSIAGAILLINFLGIMIGIGVMPLSSISHLVRLLSGVFNGVGMMLLFARFISIEFFYTKKSGFKRGFYYVGTIFILPLYATAQPLYGIFDLDDKDIGNALLLKAVILLICFIGKLFLFLFIMLILENEWLHKYFYWILLERDSMDNVAATIESDLRISHHLPNA